MPRYEAERELLASREDVWEFIAEPYHLADWWPGIGGVQPDRRRLAPGARWRLAGSARPRLLRPARASDTLVVRDVRRPALAAFHVVRQRLDVELRLVPTAHDRTLAHLTVETPWFVRPGRALPRRALERLHALCQTAASL